MLKSRRPSLQNIPLQCDADSEIALLRKDSSWVTAYSGGVRLSDQQRKRVEPGCLLDKIQDGKCLNLVDAGGGGCGECGQGFLLSKDKRL